MMITQLGLLQLVLWLLSFVTALYISLYVAYSCRARGMKHGSPLPPGPAPLPLVGNVHQVPRSFPQRVFAEWGRRFGDVFNLSLLGKRMIILNSLQATQDLLVYRGVDYSGRPHSTMISELIEFDPILPLIPYGDQFRLHRKWLQTWSTDKDAQERCRITQERETHALLKCLLEKPDEFFSSVKRFAGVLMTEVAYGRTVTFSGVDEFIDSAEVAMKRVTEAGMTAGALVDFIPVLKHLPLWFPGAGFKRNALEVRRLIRDAMDTPYEKVKTAVINGTAHPSFATSLIENALKTGTLTPQVERDIKGVNSIMYAGGTDTSATVMLTFILAMVLHPDVYEKAQAEVDRVVGHTRLPNMGDRNAMPYLESVLKEVYRWNPPFPLGIPHQLTTEDEYRGWRMPKGSMILTNIWAMTRDTNYFDEPERFWPERYEQSRKQTEVGADPRSLAFGFGRRICPGRELADSSVWLVAASILSTFNLRPAFGPDGCEKMPIPQFTSDSTSHVVPFECRILPRSREAADLISHL